MKNQENIIHTLNLAASDTREETLKSIVLCCIYDYTPLDEDKIVESIRLNYDFEPYKPELDKLVNGLKADSQIKNNNGKLELSDDTKEFIDQNDIEIKDQDKARYRDFCSFTDYQIVEDVDQKEKEKLWKVFNEYIYDCFYEYGKEAVKIFNPYLDGQSEQNKNNGALNNALGKFNDTKLDNIFKYIIKNYPDYASSDHINYLNDLANKSMAFASLGVNPDIAKSSFQDNSLIDNWVIYLDTNVLYSLLDLHIHPENYACKALIKLVNEHKDQIKVKFRYSEFTQRELYNKKKDFNYINNHLNDGIIRGILRSDKLDDFTKKYYEKLLVDRDSTVHPAEKIDLSRRTFKEKEGIDISRNTDKRIEQLGEEYLNEKIQDYRKFIEKHNEIRLEHANERKQRTNLIERSDKQIDHDIKLRELILEHRGEALKREKDITFNSLKYYGITLDDQLIKYDQNKIRKEQDNEKSYPIFFKPSFLLNKLIRTLPIKTEDHKAAFLKALTSRGYNTNILQSRDILKIVNYLKSNGITNENIINDLISEQLFLDNFKKLDRNNESEEVFIENELNRKYEEVKSSLQEANSQLKGLSEDVDEKDEINKSLEQNIKENKEKLKLYESGLQKLNAKIEEIRQSKEEQKDKSSPLPLEDEGYKNQLIKNIEEQIESYKDSKIRKWQNNVFWNLFWVVLVTLFGIYLIFNPKFLFTKESIGVQVGIAFITVLIDGIFFWLIRTRFWSPLQINQKRESIKTPKHLKDQLDELKN